MILKAALMTGLFVFLGGALSAQPYSGPGTPDPYGYYSQYDHDGYFDRDGRYHRLAPPPVPRYVDPAPPPPPPAPAALYSEGRYEEGCRKGNAAAGTIFGALAGGLLGSAASHGNTGATLGGVVLGGVLGNTVAREIDCDDQPYAFRVYAQGLNGDIGRRYEWRHGNAYGYFTPIREFRRRGQVCRSFTEVSYRRGRPVSHEGIACRASEGHWRFD
jgi:surface antigen